jgi:hypothetical protein
VGIFLRQLVDPLLGASHGGRSLSRSTGVVDDVRRGSADEMCGGVVLLVVGAAGSTGVVVMVVVVVGELVAGGTDVVGAGAVGGGAGECPPARQVVGTASASNLLL